MSDRDGGIAAERSPDRAHIRQKQFSTRTDRFLWQISLEITICVKMEKTVDRMGGNEYNQINPMGIREREKRS